MIAADFRSWRMRMGWSQREAALHLGRSIPSIKNYERDGTPDTTIDLATAHLEQQRAEKGV